MTDIVEGLRAEIDADVNEPLDRLLERAADEIERLRKALQFIADGYDNHNVNHVDYRVKVYQVALDALSSTECKTTDNIEGGA